MTKKVERSDNVISILDEPRLKRVGANISLACPQCHCQTATVLYVTQQPFYEDSDDPVDVAYYLVIRCDGKRCEAIGIAEQRGKDEYERVFPPDPPKGV